MMTPDQPHLSNDQLRVLLEPYRAKYPMEHDDQLARLGAKRFFDREDLSRVVHWKFDGWPARLRLTEKRMAGNSDRDIEDLTSRAFRCGDDLGALLLVELLDGVGKALGSAILMTHDQARYSVIDVNAVRAIQALGYLRDCPPPTDQDRTLPNWVRYLAAARDVAARTGWTLRNVDRALYIAGKNNIRPD